MASTTKAVTKDNMIRAAGMVQSVIASGKPMAEWHRHVMYGLNLSNHFAHMVAGLSRAKPPIPKPLTLKEKNVG